MGFTMIYDDKPLISVFSPQDSSVISQHGPTFELMPRAEIKVLPHFWALRTAIKRGGRWPISKVKSCGSIKSYGSIDGYLEVSINDIKWRYPQMDGL